MAFEDRERKEATVLYRAQGCRALLTELPPVHLGGRGLQLVCPLGQRKSLAVGRAVIVVTRVVVRDEVMVVVESSVPLGALTADAGS